MTGHWAIPHVGQRLVAARVIGSTAGGATVALVLVTLKRVRGSR